jgi:excisionase family DNA binding protein
MSADNPLQLYTYGDVAKLLLVDKRTVERYVERKELVPVRFGRLVRFRHGDIQEWIEKHLSPEPETGPETPKKSPSIPDLSPIEVRGRKGDKRLKAPR